MWRAHVKAARACARPRLRPRPPESARQSARVAMLTPPPRYLFFFFGSVHVRIALPVLNVEIVVLNVYSTRRTPDLTGVDGRKTALC